MKKLPVIKIMIGALYYPWAMRTALFKALSILIVAGVLLSVMWRHTKESAPEHFGWVVMILFWTLYTLFAVICHRVVLLGAGSVPEYGVTRVSARDFYFALAVVKIVLISIPATIVGFAICLIPVWILDTLVAADVMGIFFEYFLVVSSLSQLFTFSRLGLILPATAIDQRPALRWSWQATRGNTLRLMLVLGLLPWLVSLPLALIPENPGIVGYGLNVLAWWLLLPIEITVLSLCYKELAQEQPMT